MIENKVQTLWSNPTKEYELCLYQVKITVKGSWWGTKVVASSPYRAIMLVADKCRKNKIENLKGISILKDPVPVDRSQREKKLKMKLRQYFTDVMMLDE